MDRPINTQLFVNQLNVPLKTSWHPINNAYKEPFLINLLLCNF